MSALLWFVTELPEQQKIEMKITYFYSTQTHTHKMATCVEMFIVVYGIYLLMTFVMPSIMLEFNVFPRFARAWLNHTKNEVLFRDALMIIVFKVLNDRDHDRL